jgi:hypothetical protein
MFYVLLLFHMSLFLSHVFLLVLEHSMICTAIGLYPILNSICTALQPVIHDAGCAGPPVTGVEACAEMLAQTSWISGICGPEFSGLHRHHGNFGLRF